MSRFLIILRALGFSGRGPASSLGLTPSVLPLDPLPNGRGFFCACLTAREAGLGIVPSDDSTKAICPKG